ANTYKQYRVPSRHRRCACGSIHPRLAESWRRHHREGRRSCQSDVFRGTRCWNHRCHHRTPQTLWDGTGLVRDGACSGFGRRDRADCRAGSPVEWTDRDPGAKWVLHRVVCRIGLAVSACCAWV
ncbi:hypothetical protein AVDCRST_MAG92-3259, partial [uncultured Coleofasciculus sp.]